MSPGNLVIQHKHASTHIANVGRGMIGRGWGMWFGIYSNLALLPVLLDDVDDGGTEGLMTILDGDPVVNP